MNKVRFIALALLAAAAMVLGGATKSRAHGPPAGPPDTSVVAWDAVGTQAFSAAGLTPAEGHVIFAYVAIAVYDSVMAIEGGYQPFAVEVEVDNASPQAAVAAAARRILAHYLPAQAPRSSIRRTQRPWPQFPRAPRRRTASRSARASRSCSSPSARVTASGHR